MRTSMTALALALALAGCPMAKDVPDGQGGGDAALRPVVACMLDQDCPTPVVNDPICAPKIAVCHQGACSVEDGPRLWDQDPGACSAAPDCRCQDLATSGCAGTFQCLAGRCLYGCDSCGSQQPASGPEVKIPVTKIGRRV